MKDKLLKVINKEKLLNLGKGIINKIKNINYKELSKKIFTKRNFFIFLFLFFVMIIEHKISSTGTHQIKNTIGIIGIGLFVDFLIFRFTFTKMFFRMLKKFFSRR